MSPEIERVVRAAINLLATIRWCEKEDEPISEYVLEDASMLEAAVNKAKGT